MTSVQSWAGETIDGSLAAELEGSLSLGIESFSMSDKLLPLIENVSVGDYGAHMGNGDVSFLHFDSMQSGVQPKKTRLALSGDEDMTSAIKRFCVSSEDKENDDNSPGSMCRHSSSVPDLRNTGSPPTTPMNVLNSDMLSQMLQISDSPSSPFSPGSPNVRNSDFQYVLGAATSIATKINEESMTYLNQGQSYEIKLKKLGDLTGMRGKLLKSIVRVGFHERRLQYAEKEQIAQWKLQRPNERILEIDIPLSYGLYEVFNDPDNIQMGEFFWDPTVETGVFVKINCISTEFTPKKHGGEKGAPFRIQIETFSEEENYSMRLHVASCQVKVFKPKGADRKHKTDREKMSKRPKAEQEKYEVAYDCTVLTECSPDWLYVTSSSSENNELLPIAAQPLPLVVSPKLKSPGTRSARTSQYTKTAKYERGKSESFDHSDLSSQSQEKSTSTDSFEMGPDVEIKEEQVHVSSEFSIAEISHWLQNNHFPDYVDVFSNFSGLDMLRLNQDDCVKICGLTQGLRLFNALHCSPIIAKKLVFVRLINEEIFHAIYLHDLKAVYLTLKLSRIFKIPLDNIRDLHMSVGPAINYLVTDEVVVNIRDQSLFILEIIQFGQAVDKYTLVLKPHKES